MEDQLFAALYRLFHQENSRRARAKRVQFSDADICDVAMWAVLHDRPVSWACRRRNWPACWTRDLPSAATMSRRLRTLSVLLLIEQVFYRLLALRAVTLCLCRRLDSKPLPIGGFSKDRDARWGYATGGKYRGYKLFGCWRGEALSIVPEALVLGAMNSSDQAGALHLIDRLNALHQGRCGGYLLADSTHDTNPLHEHAAGCGFQLLAPRKQPGTQLGHRDHSPHRLRSIEMLEGPDGFGRRLYRLRGQIERDYGNLASFGGGLQPLPGFVRRPRRVALWVTMKLLINALRICKNHGLTP